MTNNLCVKGSICFKVRVDCNLKLCSRDGKTHMLSHSYQPNGFIDNSVPNHPCLSAMSRSAGAPTRRVTPSRAEGVTQEGNHRALSL